MLVASRRSPSRHDVAADQLLHELGGATGGLRTGEVRRIVQGVAAHADLVGFTIAEYYPRQVMQLGALIEDLQLVGSPPYEPDRGDWRVLSFER